MISFKKSTSSTSTILLCISEAQLKSNNSNIKDTKIQKAVLALRKATEFNASEGQLFPIVFENQLVVILGVGKEKDLSLTNLRIYIRKALLSTLLNSKKGIEIVPHSISNKVIVAIIEAVKIGTYTWDKYKKTKAHKPKISIIANASKLYEQAEDVCNGVNLARDLVNENADVATSKLLEKEIKSLIKGNSKFKIEVLNKKELKAKGLGLHLAVNQGSANEPKLIIVSYSGGKSSEKPIALIGKGITFDTGGLNIKPSGNIETMRMDMGGTAAVIGTLKNIVKLKPKKNIIFACAVAENVTGSLSYKPGDVISGYAKKSVEVLNTDAEGRLVLADAISYVVKNYKPSKIIDIATLTGAVIVALAYDYTGLVTTDDKFSRDLIHSSNETDDRAWRLPTYPELKDSVKSQIADIKNLGFPKGAGGTITAAEFLRQFTEGTTWAHLDIAGTSFVDGSSRMYYGHGATGAGVRLLTHYLTNH